MIIQKILVNIKMYDVSTFNKIVARIINTIFYKLIYLIISLQKKKQILIINIIQLIHFIILYKAKHMIYIRYKAVITYIIYLYM